MALAKDLSGAWKSTIDKSKLDAYFRGLTAIWAIEQRSCQNVQLVHEHKRCFHIGL